MAWVIGAIVLVAAWCVVGAVVAFGVGGAFRRGWRALVDPVVGAVTDAVGEAVVEPAEPGLPATIPAARSGASQATPATF